MEVCKFEDTRRRRAKDGLPVWQCTACKITVAVEKPPQARQCGGLSVSFAPPADEKSGSGPSMAQRAHNFARAIIAFAKNPRLCTNDEQAARWAACEACPLKAGNWCKECGCNLHAKTWAKAFECPLGKWKKIDETENSANSGEDEKKSA